MKKKAKQLSGLAAWLPSKKNRRKETKEFFGLNRKKIPVRLDPKPTYSAFFRFKCAVYRYTGLYFCNEELLEYLQSESYFKALKKLNRKEPMEFSQSMLIGLWESENHLYRPCVLWKYSYRKYGKIPFFIASIFCNIHMGLVALKWDLLRKSG